MRLQQVIAGTAAQCVAAVAAQQRVVAVAAQDVERFGLGREIEAPAARRGDDDGLDLLQLDVGQLVGRYRRAEISGVEATAPQQHVAMGGNQAVVAIATQQHIAHAADQGVVAEQTVQLLIEFVGLQPVIVGRTGVVGHGLQGEKRYASMIRPPHGPDFAGRSPTFDRRKKTCPEGGKLCSGAKYFLSCKSGLRFTKCLRGWPA